MPVSGGDTITLGDFTITFFPVCHSIVHGYGLGIETPAGRIVHTGDFKIDRTPLDGHATDLPAIRAFSEKGVMLLLSDSTNAEREGFALTEREIKSTLSEIFRQAAGRIVVTLFSSHIQRMANLRFSQVLLKISGEALAGGKPFGIDNQTITDFSREIVEACAEGARISLVIGGGNIFRGVSEQAAGMSLAKTGQIQNTCQPNALLTLKEYLMDYATPETRAIGEKAIVEHLKDITNPKIRDLTIQELKKIETGTRDLYF